MMAYILTNLAKIVKHYSLSLCNHKDDPEKHIPSIIIAKIVFYFLYTLLYTNYF